MREGVTGERLPTWSGVSYFIHVMIDAQSRQFITQAITAAAAQKDRLFHPRRSSALSNCAVYTLCLSTSHPQLVQYNTSYSCCPLITSYRRVASQITPTPADYTSSAGLPLSICAQNDGYRRNYKILAASIDLACNIIGAGAAAQIYRQNQNGKYENDERESILGLQKTPSKCVFFAAGHRRAIHCRPIYIQQLIYYIDGRARHQLSRHCPTFPRESLVAD